MSANPNIVELDEMPIIVKIPKDAALVELNITMLDEHGDLMRVQRCLSASEIRECRQDFLDNVEFGDDYDAMYTLTDEGRAYAEKLLRG